MRRIILRPIRKLSIQELKNVMKYVRDEMNIRAYPDNESGEITLYPSQSRINSVYQRFVNDKGCNRDFTVVESDLPRLCETISKINKIQNNKI